MKNIFLATVLLPFLSTLGVAADLPDTKGAPDSAPPPPVFSWEGGYVGAQVGYGWGSAHPSDTTALFSLPSGSTAGILGGGHIGYNFQVGQIVYGFEGDVNGSSQRDSAFDGVDYPTGVTYNIHKNFDVSIRARLGYAFDRTLIYVTGGGAYGDFHTSYSNGVGSFDSFDHGRYGWTGGAGVEYAVTNNWLVRAEYRYTDYGYLVDSPVSTGFDSISRHERDNRVQVGFSYKFDSLTPSAPVVAKY